MTREAIPRSMEVTIVLRIFSQRGGDDLDEGGDETEDSDDIVSSNYSLLDIINVLCILCKWISHGPRRQQPQR